MCASPRPPSGESAPETRPVSGVYGSPVETCSDPPSQVAFRGIDRHAPHRAAHRSGSHILIRSARRVHVTPVLSTTAAGCKARTSFGVTDNTPHPDGLCPLDVFDIHDIRRAFGVSRTAAYALTRESGFPAPYVVSSRCYRWPAREVLDFRNALKAADNGRDHVTPFPRTIAATAEDRTGHGVINDEAQFRCPCPLDVFDIHDIQRVFGVSRTAAYALTREDDFPAPYVISSRCYRWCARSVAQYRRSLHASGGAA